ncbi:hypothetical protein BGX20_006863, partial [Mortierella sp. AD010]
HSWNVNTITIIGRPGRIPIEYFELCGCTALKRFVWRSTENPRNHVTDFQWNRMIQFIQENKMRMEDITIEYCHRGWERFWETFSRNPIPCLTSLSLQKTDISVDSAHYFWAVSRSLEILIIKDCTRLRHLRLVYTDLKAAA